MRIGQRRTILIVLLLVTHHVSVADTIHPGGNVVNQTWTPAGSPYVIQGDITVPVGAFLTIQAGVQVQCASTDAQGAGRDPARVEIMVRGELDVDGTASLPVTFKGTSAAAGSWYGIILASSASVTINHSTVQYANTGLLCESTASIQANDLGLSSNQTAIAITAGSPALNRIRAFANQTAIQITGSGIATIVNSAFHANSVQGIEIRSSATGGIAFNHCTIHSNGTYGIYVGSPSSAPVTLKNSVISGHPFGVYRVASAGGSFTTTYSDLWNATNLVNAASAAGVFSADPLYIDVDGSDNVFGTSDDIVRLKPTSPCRFRADDSSDLGAYPIISIRIWTIEFVGNDVRIRFATVPNLIHQVEHTDDFNTWTPLGSELVGTGGTLERTHTGARTLPRRFYRVRYQEQ